MASIRRLKKDVDYLTFSVIADCFNYSIVSGKNNTQVSEIVQNIITSRNSLRSQINAARKMEKKDRKAQYKTIFKDLFVSVDAAFTKLSETVKEA